MTRALFLLAMVMCLVGCGNQAVPAKGDAVNEAALGSQPTADPVATDTVAATDTPIPPTATVAPSPTAVPPTATPEPTITPVPTDTPVPPTATSEPTAVPTLAVATATPPADWSSCRYIGNKNSMKFHRASCGSVKQMKESNRVCLQTREEAVAAGYVPCGNCKP